MHDDGATRKAQATEMFNSRAQGFDALGAFAHGPLWPSVCKRISDQTASTSW